MSSAERKAVMMLLLSFPLGASLLVAELRDNGER